MNSGTVMPFISTRSSSRQGGTDAIEIPIQPRMPTKRTR
jgi:hypothetical protein